MKAIAILFLILGSSSVFATGKGRKPAAAPKCFSEAVTVAKKEQVHHGYQGCKNPTRPSTHQTSVIFDMTCTAQDGADDVRVTIVFDDIASCSGPHASAFDEITSGEDN